MYAIAKSIIFITFREDMFYIITKVVKKSIHLVPFIIIRKNDLTYEGMQQDQCAKYTLQLIINDNICHAEC
jgi:hypothetical protein